MGLQGCVFRCRLGMECRVVSLGVKLFLDTAGIAGSVGIAGLSRRSSVVSCLCRYCRDCRA